MDGGGLSELDHFEQQVQIMRKSYLEVFVKAYINEFGADSGTSMNHEKLKSLLQMQKKFVAKLRKDSTRSCAGADEVVVKSSSSCGFM